MATLEDNILGIYGNEIKSFNRIDLNEEITLSKKSLGGDLNARNKLVTSNLKLVIHIAKFYSNKSLNFDDLVCEGNKGLITAAEKYDYKFGTRFSTYAAWWIKESITSALKNEYKNKELFIENLSMLNNDDSSSIDLKSDKNEYSKYNTDVSEENALNINEDLYNDVLLYLDELTPKENKIIKHYFGIEDYDELNIPELSEKYGLTNMRISKIIDDSLRKIRCKHLEKSFI